MKKTPYQMTDRSAAYFTVASTKITPDKMCSRLGIKCDSAIWKGTPNRSGKPKTHPMNIAVFRSSLDDSVGMEEHVQNILARIKPARKHFKQLSSSCVLTISFNYRVQLEGGWNFSHEVLAELAKLAVPCVFSLETSKSGAMRASKKMTNMKATS